MTRGCDVMLVANAVISVADGFQRDLAVLMRQRNQLAAGVLFRRAAFVGIDVGVVAAQHRHERTGSAPAGSRHIRASAVEDEENCNVGSKMLFEFLQSPNGVRIVAVADYMALVGAGNGFAESRDGRRHCCRWQNCGQAGRNRFHSANNVAE